MHVWRIEKNNITFIAFCPSMAIQNPMPIDILEFYLKSKPFFKSVIQFCFLRSVESGAHLHTLEVILVAGICCVLSTPPLPPSLSVAFALALSP